MNVLEHIAKLRTLMEQFHIDAYLIPSSDYHLSEYVGEHFQARAFISGFTGSAGTVIVTATDAALWTDGRYFIQAEKELSGSTIRLYKSGLPDVPTIDAYLESVLTSDGVLGFDGRLFPMEDVLRYRQKFRIVSDYDLVGMIWKERPALSSYPIFLLEEQYTGETALSKLSRIREAMRNHGATSHLLSSLDDIAWLFNFRGRDTAYTPVALCYAFIEMDCAHLFIEASKLSLSTRTYFSELGVLLHDYASVYEFVSRHSYTGPILYDPKRTNFALYHRIPKEVKKIEKTNPCVLLKSIKNETEIKNLKTAHIKDGIAHTKFMYWVKTTFEKEAITELTASAKLEELRAMQEHFLWPSFAPICAYGEHAAIIHYSSSKATDCLLKSGNFFLTDTGGNYLEGSTDITRTIALGRVSDRQKRNYTLVLRGNLALANARFAHGCSGQNLDALARQPLWSHHMDFPHGTGHGVGYLLSVHEPGCRISRYASDESTRSLESGMVLTDEPGIYLEGQYGIRLENELLVRTDISNDFGQFMHFEVITYVPFDLDAIDITLLNDTEKEQLNTYHQMVYDTLAPHLTSDEQLWLKKYTRKI